MLSKCSLKEEGKRKEGGKRGSEERREKRGKKAGFNGRQKGKK